MQTGFLSLLLVPPFNRLASIMNRSPKMAACKRSPWVAKEQKRAKAKESWIFQVELLFFSLVSLMLKPMNGVFCDFFQKADPKSATNIMLLKEILNKSQKRWWWPSLRIIGDNRLCGKNKSMFMRFLVGIELHRIGSIWVSVQILILLPASGILDKLQNL